MFQLPPFSFTAPPEQDWARALLNGCSQIFLQGRPLCGLVLLLAIAWGVPQALGPTLLGGAAGWLTATRRRYGQDDIAAGIYAYNGALLGLLLGSQFAWTWLVPLLIIASAGLSSLLLQQWLRYYRRSQGLAPYTAPFVLLGWLLLALATPLQLQAVSSDLLPGNPSAPWTLLQAVLRGLSQVLLINDPFSGLLVLLGLLCANRQAALWALCGSLVSLLLGLWLGYEAEALNGLFGYNGALVALALYPYSQRKWPILLAIALCAVLQPGFASLGLSAPLTAPFILSCWLMHSSHLLLKRGAAASQPPISAQA